MSGEFFVTVTGDRKVALRFETFPTKLHDRLLSRITALTAVLAAKVRARVPVLTGKLKSEITQRVFDDAPRKITGRISVDGEYAKAGALEFGAHGSARVDAHMARLNLVFGHRLGAPLQVMVAAHRRTLNLPAKRFMRGPFLESGAAIKAELEDAVSDTIEENP